MENYIKNIYELLYRPVVTPYNLLENAKLPNYKYVTYYKEESGLIAEMQCMTEDGNEAIFHYHFNHDDHLRSVYMTKGGQKELVFDRQTELQKLTAEYLDKTKVNEVAI
ncbi:MAG: hypothetical protein P4L49_07075 [Desulfosporosinus sp.]|nr:hypothetical protein [Desulfosporosinus sp.]